MATNPYIEKNPGDLIKAEDWNEVQIQTREEIQSHDHTGGEKGLRISSDGIADGSIETAHLQDGAVTGEKIAPLSIRDALVSAEAAIAESKIAFDAAGHDHDGTNGKKISFNNLDDIPADFPPSAHTHSGEDLTIGDLSISGDLQVEQSGYFAGNVGIGTTDPQEKLHIKGEIGGGHILFEDPGAAADRHKFRIYHSDQYLTFEQLTDAGSVQLTVMRFGQNGNVGIGQSPENWQGVYTVLDIADGHSLASSDNGSAFQYFNAYDTGPYKKLKKDGYGANWYFLAADGKLYYRTDATSRTAGDNLSLTEKFSIDKDGNVRIGIGTTNSGFKLHTDGTSYASSRAGAGFDYAEYFESLDGEEIPAGTSVVLEADKIRPAKKNETPIGIISTNPVIVGGVHPEWPQKYLRDEFGNPIMEEYREEIMVPKTEKVTRERQKVEQKTIEEEVTRTEIVFENGRYYQKKIIEPVTREVEERVFEDVDLYDEDDNLIGVHQIPVMETYEDRSHR